MGSGSSSEAERGLVRVNGVRLYYERRGTGPAVLIIPGIPAVVSDCLPLAENLSDRFTVIAYDNRGSGQSDKPDHPYTMQQLARDAAKLLEALGVERAHVLGFSMGGMIAQHLALDLPDRVRRLVLACTHAGLRHAIPPSREVARAFQRDTATWRERIELLAPYAFEKSYPEREPEHFAAFVEKKARDEQPLYAYRRQLAASIRHDSHDRLPEISQPTLVITGSADAVVPAENSRLLAQRIPSARLSVIEQAGHLFFMEKPAETIRVLREFLLAAE